MISETPTRKGDPPAHPFIRSSRRFMPLRREVDEFIDLVRLLNRQAQEAEDPENIESTRAMMYEAVDRMVDKAGKRG